ncbi:hypothetical protein ACSYAD_25980 [Acaryochloris marina NIES-2412]|uniref:hypothetical protein n=1 Tax=Acaryochloris marina TaxID=155978 RepID=UPI004058FA96
MIRDIRSYLNNFFIFFFNGKINYGVYRKVEVYTSEKDVSKIDDETRYRLDKSSEFSQINKSKSGITATKIILSVNKLLSIICLLSFIAILIYPFFFPNKTTPDTIQNAFFTTLGWLGSAFVNFFQFNKKG